MEIVVPRVGGFALKTDKLSIGALDWLNAFVTCQFALLKPTTSIDLINPMLVITSRTTKLVPDVSSSASSVFIPAKDTAQNDTSAIGSLPFKVQCKSALALVNDRRIDFVRATNVRIMNRLDGNLTEHKGKKKETQELTAVEAVERLLIWQYSKKIGPGLANLGNTCYLNSVLQCLSYTPCFAQLLLDKKVSTSFHGGNTLSKVGKTFDKNGFCGSNNHVGFCSLRAMSRLLQSVHTNSAVRVLQPKELVMNVRHISKRFRIGRQEDSHEFFRLLLDSMQRACLRKARIKSESHLAASTTFVHRIFGGKLKSSLKCAKCGYLSERFDDFLDLSLEISNGVNSVTGALQHFTAIEKLDNHNAWKCSSCGKPSRAEKGLTIAEGPNVLVIQLKRFDLMFGKIKRHIEFPCSLDIMPGMSKICEDRRRGRTKYELHAVLVHAGFSTDCGHYYAFVKGSSGQWYEMNDDSVRWVSLATVLQQKAYMLFYSRVLPPSERPKPKEGKADDKPKLKEMMERQQIDEVSKKMGRQVLVETKELDMNGFLSSLKTTMTDPVNATDADKYLVAIPAKAKTVVTFNVTSKSSVSPLTFAVRHQMKGLLPSSFGGHIGRLYKFGLVSWKSSPRLLMTRSVKEIPIHPKVKAAVSATVNLAGAARVPFDPRHLRKVGVRNAALFGREVDKWAGETDVESSEMTSSSYAASLEMVDNEMASKHDQVLNALKQEEWKHRNVRRQDYWDENLDTGKVKKVKKRKEFVSNEGRKNVFQSTLLRKKNDAKRQRMA